MHNWIVLVNFDAVHCSPTVTKLHWILFNCKFALNIVEMQYCTGYCSIAKLHWILFKCNGWQCNVAQHADPGEGRWNCGGFQGHSFQWRWATTSGQLSMQLCISKFIDAIMCFKNYQLSVMHFRYYGWHYAFQQSSMQLCISTMVPWLAVYSLQIVILGHQGQLIMIFFFDFVPEINCLTHISFCWENDLLDLPARVFYLIYRFYPWKKIILSPLHYKIHSTREGKIIISEQFDFDSIEFEKEKICHLFFKRINLWQDIGLKCEIVVKLAVDKCYREGVRSQ